MPDEINPADIFYMSAELFVLKAAAAVVFEVPFLVVTALVFFYLLY